VDDRWSANARGQVERLVRQTTGDALSVKLLEVPDIPLTAAGKLQVVVNRCGTRTLNQVTTEV
jgi:hypothetical protein